MSGYLANLIESSEYAYHIIFPDIPHCGTKSRVYRYALMGAVELCSAISFLSLCASTARLRRSYGIKALCQSTVSSMLPP